VFNNLRVTLMLRHIRPALSMLLLMSLITGVFYPLLVTGIGQALFPSRANGSIIEENGRTVGSALIGQQFTTAGYFWSRLSATSPFPYNAAASTGSNYGPLNPALLKATKARVELLRSADSSNTRVIPVDLVTGSGSGLDPHISIAAAHYQIPRVARERHVPEQSLYELVREHTDSKDLGILGEPGVNVVELNLALDGISKEQK
jgi:potassium-transporting ATPase KdpC subunit